MRIFNRKKSRGGEGEGKTESESKNARKNASRKGAKSSSPPSARKNIVQIIDTAERANIPMYSQSLESQSLAYSGTPQPQARPVIQESEWGAKWPEATPQSVWENPQWANRQVRVGEDDLDEDDNRATIPPCPERPPPPLPTESPSNDKSRIRRHVKYQRTTLERVDEEHGEPVFEEFASLSITANISVEGFEESDLNSRTNEYDEEGYEEPDLSSKSFGYGEEGFEEPDLNSSKYGYSEGDFEQLDLNPRTYGYGEITDRLKDVGNSGYSSDFSQMDYASGDRNFGNADFRNITPLSASGHDCLTSAQIDRLKRAYGSMDSWFASCNGEEDEKQAPEKEEGPEVEAVAEVEEVPELDLDNLMSAPDSRSYLIEEIEVPDLDFNNLADSPVLSYYETEDEVITQNSHDLADRTGFLDLPGSNGYRACDFESELGHGNVMKSCHSSDHELDEVELHGPKQADEPADSLSYANDYQNVVEELRVHTLGVPKAQRDDILSSSTEYSEFWQPSKNDPMVTVAEADDEICTRDAVRKASPMLPSPNVDNVNSFWPDEPACHELTPREGDEPDLNPGQLNAFRCLNGDPKMMKPRVPEGFNLWTFVDAHRNRKDRKLADTMSGKLEQSEEKPLEDEKKRELEQSEKKSLEDRKKKENEESSSKGESLGKTKGKTSKDGENSEVHESSSEGESSSKAKGKSLEDKKKKKDDGSLNEDEKSSKAEGKSLEDKNKKEDEDSWRKVKVKPLNNRKRKRES